MSIISSYCYSTNLTFFACGNVSRQRSAMQYFVVHNHVNTRFVAARTCHLQTPWSECSQECGSIGSRSRDTTCSAETIDGKTVDSSTVSVYEECFVPCPTDEPIAVDTTTEPTEPTEVVTTVVTTTLVDSGPDFHVETTTRMSIMYYVV